MSHSIHMLSIQIDAIQEFTNYNRTLMSPIVLVDVDDLGPSFPNVV